MKKLTIKHSESLRYTEFITKEWFLENINMYKSESFRYFYNEDINRLAIIFRDFAYLGNYTFNKSWRSKSFLTVLRIVFTSFNIDEKDVETLVEMVNSQDKGTINLAFQIIKGLKKINLVYFNN